ncbi:MAG: hypothetical protein IT165_30110 [Bryobacterales bacterium]|nr:hypothetical protein [Bryobacterales bacterium]
MDLRRDHVRHVAQAASAQPRRHGDVLLAADGNGLAMGREYGERTRSQV